MKRQSHWHIHHRVPDQTGLFRRLSANALALRRERCQRRCRPRQDAELQSQRHAATGPA